ncbi:MAG: aminotransferase class I/II-fold pyridoxal phosphate-dependent enzyme [Clostridia bacterium]|nr:aminotransferase class I/II-fold pyridoxal phosphate-dependent enzyme [Clostridia bacterium]
MKELSRKNPLFTDSVIRRMTRIAIENNAINLAQGFPDFDPPKELTDRLEEISHIGPHQYPITMGAPNFRKALCEKCGRFMGRTLDPNNEVVVTIGSTEAMVDTIFALTNPGDKIIIFSPYFENYKAQTIMAECQPVFVPLIPPKFNFDPLVLEEAFKDEKVKAILICNPSNPSGKVFTYEELTFIADLCKKYDVYAIMDEVYEHIIYDNNKHTYMNSIPGMWERTVSCSSLSKTYSITGWRLGYAIAPKYLMDRIKQYHDFNTVGAASPLMEAAVVGLKMPDSYYKEFGDHYAHMKKLFTDGLKSIGIEFTDPQGAYFVLADIGKYMKKGQSDVDFCVDMTKRVGVACVPGSSFFNEDVNHIVRVHFAKKDETLFEALPTRRVKLPLEDVILVSGCA